MSHTESYTRASGGEGTIIGIMEQTKMTRIIAALAVVAVLIIGSVAIYARMFGPQDAARTVAENFVAREQFVPLSGEQQAVVAAIREQYEPLITNALLLTWVGNPQIAPGRLTSSPWPERLTVTSVTKQGTGYIVTGNIVLMTSAEKTSGGNAGIVPVVMLVIKEDGKWKIAAYEEQRQNRQIATSTSQG